MNASTAGANDATTSELNIFPGVNFINILRVHFAPIFRRQKLQS